MAKIVISYRRSDSAVFAGRVHDRIVNRYGDQSVFIDVDKIPFGKDFRVHIQQELTNSDAVLVIIGPKWLGPARGGRSRIMDATDPVRIEVESALSKGIPTIPILVGSTSMPKPEQLPETLRDFAFVNAAPVDTGRDFHRDLSRVIAAIDQILHLPPDAIDAHARSSDDRRVAEANSETENARQLAERDRIANEAQAARQRDDEERRQKAEAEARQRAAEDKQAVESRTKQQTALYAGATARDDEPVVKIANSAKAGREPPRSVSAAHYFVATWLLLSAVFGLFLVALLVVELNAHTTHMTFVAWILLAAVCLIPLAAICAALGTMRGKQWSRWVGLIACLLATGLAVFFAFLNGFVVAPSQYLGTLSQFTAYAIAAESVACAVFYVAGWKSDSWIGRSIPENLGVFAGFGLVVGLVPFGFFPALARVGNPIYNNVTPWLVGAIAAMVLAYAYCLMLFRGQFGAMTATSSLRTVS